MSLLVRYRELLFEAGEGVFRQKRTVRRAVEHALAWPILLGRRTISRTIWALGRQARDWTADYRLFSRRVWDPDDWFVPVIRDFLTRHPRGPIPLALDDTGLRKTGRKIANAHWQYDAMSPPFHANLCFGQRFLGGSLLFPHYRRGARSARAYPVRFTEAPFVKKPGKRADAEQWRLYRQRKKQCGLSWSGRALIEGIRRQVDALGGSARRLLVAVDNSFCNRILFRTPLDRVDLPARCRKDAVLAWPVSGRGQRRYSPRKFTPEEVRRDPTLPYRKLRVYFAGRCRVVRCKLLSGVLWQHGARTRPLRLIVLAPRPYRPKGGHRIRYRDPAYLLTTDLDSTPTLLVQTYHDRWEIEVNHRDEKDLFGVGQAQVRHPAAASRHPAFAVACYSLLLLAALQVFGVQRNQAFAPLPRWRKHAPRASLLDILTLLRAEIREKPISLPDPPDLTFNPTASAFG